MKKFFTLLLTCAFMATAVSGALAARATRDLVFEDDDAAAKKADESTGQKTIAIKATIMLKRDGQTSTVAPSHEFKSGDQVKLVFTPSTTGYVYWLAKGSSGGYSVLFPSTSAGMDNAVERNKEYTVPVKGSFRFDDKAGTESLLLVFGRGKIPELDQAVAEAAKQQGQASGQVASVEERNNNKRKSRDLQFEEENDEDVNTKSQVAPKGEPFVALYELTHK